MSAKLLRSGSTTGPPHSTNSTGGIAGHKRKPFKRWMGVCALERKFSPPVDSLEWKRARLPCRREDWWR
jgi:hypothetical protein